MEIIFQRIPITITQKALFFRMKMGIKIVYLSLLSRGSEFATSGSPPRPPPPPLLFSRLASFSSRRRDRRGPSQPLRPVWGPAPPSVPGPPLPICSGPAPSPPRGGDAPSSSPDPPAVGGEAGGCVGREPQGPTLRRDPGPALPTWVPRTLLKLGAERPHLSPKEKQAAQPCAPCAWA